MFTLLLIYNHNYYVCRLINIWRLKILHFVACKRNIPTETFLFLGKTPQLYIKQERRNRNNKCNCAINLPCTLCPTNQTPLADKTYSTIFHLHLRRSGATGSSNRLATPPVTELSVNVTSPRQEKGLLDSSHSAAQWDKTNEPRPFLSTVHSQL